MTRILLLAAVAFLWTVKTAQAIVIVENHQPLATIVVGGGASEQVKESAKMLQEYIQKSTGATLPISDAPGQGIVINVGQTAYVAKWPESRKAVFRNLDQDGFVLQGVDAKNFIIVGGSDWGTEFGVYEFLERYLGVRWLLPTEVGIDVPQHATVDIPPAFVHQEPAYLSREISPFKMKVKTPGDRWARFNRARGRMAFHHNLTNIFPIGKYGETHPELYALIDGKRNIPKDWRWQPNLSEPKTVDIAVEYIDKYFQEHPEATSFSLGINDSNLWDQSPASLARRSGTKNYLGLEDVSDDYFTWANAVVEKVTQKYPDKWFGTLAYNGVAEPPVKSGVNPRIVPFITYERMLWQDPKLREFGHQLTRRWGKETPVVGWYDYAYGALYLLPRLYSRQMQEYLSWGAANGVKHHYAELYPNWGEGPKAWVYLKLQWNPNQDVDALLDDWYRHTAGPIAAPRLREFYDIWEKYWTVGLYRSKWYRPGEQYLPFGAAPNYLLDISPVTVEKADNAMKEALRLADTAQRKARVAKLAQMWEFYKLGILTYQAAYAQKTAGFSDPQTEAQALAFLDKTEGMATMAQRRLELLDAFNTDPLFSDEGGFAGTTIMVRHVAILEGKTWRFSQMWRLMPWLKKSTPLRERIQQIAGSGLPALKEQAAIMLKLSGGTPAPIMTNTSFEDVKQRWWSYWDSSWESKGKRSGKLTGVNDFARTGSHSLLLTGVEYGALMTGKQAHPEAKGGTYYATVSCYVPEGNSSGQVTLELQGIDAGNRGVEGTFFSVPVTLTPGEWSTAMLPIVLPEDTKVTHLQLMIPMRGFAPDEKIYLDDAGIYKVE